MVTALMAQEVGGIERLNVVLDEWATGSNGASEKPLPEQPSPKRRGMTLEQAKAISRGVADDASLGKQRR